MFITSINKLKFYCLNSYEIHDNFFFFHLHHTHPLKDLIANNYQLYKPNSGDKIEKDVHSQNKLWPRGASSSQFYHCTKSRMVIIHNRAEQNRNTCTLYERIKNYWIV